MYELLGCDEEGLPTNVFIDNGYMQTSRPFDIEEDGWMLDQLKPTDFIAVKIGRDTEHLVSEVNHLKRELFETKRQLKKRDETLNKIYQESKENMATYLSHLLKSKGE
jgi:hypothetical protein